MAIVVNKVHQEELERFQRLCEALEISQKQPGGASWDAKERVERNVHPYLLSIIDELLDARAAATSISGGAGEPAGLELLVSCLREMRELLPEEHEDSFFGYLAAADILDQHVRISAPNLTAQQRAEELLMSLWHANVVVGDPSPSAREHVKNIIATAFMGAAAPASVTSPVEPGAAAKFDPVDEVKEWLESIKPSIDKLQSYSGTSAWKAVLEKEYASEMSEFAQWAYAFLEHRLLEKAAALTSSLGGAETPGGWVPVGERLPEFLDNSNHVECNVLCEDNSVSTAAYCRQPYAMTAKGRTSRWEKNHRIWYGRKITHWQPLPTAPHE